MKKIFKTGLLIVSLTSVLSADMVFNLGAQQFYNSVEQNYKDSTYELADSVVSTSMAYVNGAYEPKEDYTGSFSVEIKNPKNNWGVNFNMSCYLNSDGCGISLLGANGQTLNIAFDSRLIAVDGIVAEDTNNFVYQENINGTISTKENEIEVVINGKYILTVPKSDFALSYVTLILRNGAGTYGENVDMLNSLSISNN